jgi:hypothetical protein
VIRRKVERDGERSKRRKVERDRERSKRRLKLEFR